MARTILVADDDATLRSVIVRVVRRDGHEVIEAQDGASAVAQILQRPNLDLVISDLEMPRADGREVLRVARERGIPVLIVTGHASVDVAVELMRKGAANFVTKPIDLPSFRSVLVEALSALPDTSASTSAIRSTPAADPTGAKAVVGNDDAFRDVLDTVRSVAETEATVLLTGETGTGKEVVARAIHMASPRAAAPFVAVNCGAIPDALLESEMFGHARGAFTGATNSRAGRFKLAEGGTIFLDEIGDMPLSFQVKLLRVLQERQYEVLGESTPHRSDVRVIAATHRDLRALIALGKFREDLFYRLSVIEIELPPLRNRRSDIPLLIAHFIGLANQRHGRDVARATDEVLEVFGKYPWPGNVRELGNVIERMVVLRKSGDLDVADIPAAVRAAATGTGEASATPVTEFPQDGIDLKRAVDAYEDTLIREALSRTGGNQTAAAALLGLNKTTLHEKLKRKGLRTAK